MASNVLEPDPRRSPSRGREGSSAPVRRAKDFNFGDVIGEGAFGQVVEATEISNGRKVAVKILDKKHIIKENKADYVKTEKSIMNSLKRHPFVVTLLYTFQDPASLYFVMELAPNGELLSQLRKVGSLDERCTKWYAAELVDVCEYMHSKGVIHRDLKPENVLIGEDWHIRLTDFGTAKRLGDEDDPLAKNIMSSKGGDGAKRQSFVGTAEYVSPEILANKPADKAADLWAIGCIIYQMLAGRVPFKASSEYQVFQKILARDVAWPHDFPADAKDICDRLMQLDPERRLGMGKHGYDELRGHPFFKGIDWSRLAKEKPPQFRPYLPSLQANYRPSETFAVDDTVETLEALKEATAANTELPRDEKIDLLEGVSLERKNLLKQQKMTSKWVSHLFENELIVYSSNVIKRKGLFPKKRVLILTDFPRLIYIDPAANVQKGEIPWSDKLKPEIKNERTFLVHTPNRTYYLEDPNSKANDWVKAILSLEGKQHALASKKHA